MMMNSARGSSMNVFGGGVNDNTQSFQSFLERQRAREESKKEKIQFIKSATEHPHRPQINRKSDVMVKSKNATFMDRLKVEVERRTKKQENLKRAPQNMLTHEERECTFEPKINRSSKQMPSRPVEQMSQGDMERIKKKQEFVKRLLEEKELQQATFKPKTNKNDNATSFLRVSDPESYMARVRELAERQEFRKRQVQMQREEMEMRDCTFAPKTHDAPEFVKRIARSMANLKELESVNGSAISSPQRPDWR